MMILRFFIYGTTAYTILALCILMPMLGALMFGAVGGALSALSCWAVLLIRRIFKELEAQ